MSLMLCLIALNLGLLHHTLHRNDAYQQQQSTYVDLPSHGDSSLLAMEDEELGDTYATGIIALNWDNNHDSREVAQFLSLVNNQMPDQYNNLQTLLWANARADGVSYSGNSTLQLLSSNGSLLSKYLIPDRIQALSFTRVVLGNPYNPPVGDFGILGLKLSMTLSIEPHP